MSIENLISKALIKELPFVLFRKEKETNAIAYFQHSKIDEPKAIIDEPGFVFAPFDNAESSLVIPFSFANKHEFEIGETNPIEDKENIDVLDEIVASDHIRLVKKGIDYINHSDLRKVVLARKEIVRVSELNIHALFHRMCNKYPNAYIYVWYHPISGIWMGATPERLLSLKNREFNVMALASTQEYKGSTDVKWGEKERQEHQFVIDYLKDKIEEYNIVVSHTYTVKAGNLLHLRADINGTVPHGSNTLNSLINSLHPTPATCGLPKEISKKFIIQNESFNREFYTGYLGERYSDSLDLYVNLRCMKVDGDLVYIYVGGGITKDSEPEKEWLETVAKSKVMRCIL